MLRPRIGHPDGDMICSACQQPTFGGIDTNGDGFGDGKHVGIDVGPFKFYCWACYDKGYVPDHNQEIDLAFASSGLCGFKEAYVGRCKNTKPCVKHADQKCWKCGAPATQNCNDTTGLVCGVPECSKHPHIGEHSQYDGLE